MQASSLSRCPQDMMMVSQSPVHSHFLLAPLFLMVVALSVAVCSLGISSLFLPLCLNLVPSAILSLSLPRNFVYSLHLSLSVTSFWVKPIPCLISLTFCILPVFSFVPLFSVFFHHVNWLICIVIKVGCNEYCLYRNWHLLYFAEHKESFYQYICTVGALIYLYSWIWECRA